MDGSVPSEDVPVPTPEQLTKVVALDGPAGSGKSTVARLVAGALGWRFVDTGASYRAITLAVMRSGADLEDQEAVATAARGARVELVTDPAAPQVFLDGTDVTREVRGEQVTALVSAVSAVPAVREVLIALQRRTMGLSGAVVEGRDIATVVAPRAAVKVYLDARPEVRARRRAGEVSELRAGKAAVTTDAVPARAAAETGAAQELERQVAQDLARRDSLDNQTNRLQASHGAIDLDTSDLSLDEVVAAVVALVRDAGVR
ncbi:MAG: (d)CMP kinase [Frankiales bacterium]|nr:(d)CMP kinase [Frankiales bacterium]